MEYDPGASGPDGEPILLVRCGRLVRYGIPLAEIREVRPSAELQSSASCSYDRIKVVYGLYRSLLISPRDRDRFLDELASRANHLERDGDSLVQKGRPHRRSMNATAVAASVVSSKNWDRSVIAMHGLSS